MATLVSIDTRRYEENLQKAMDSKAMNSKMLADELCVSTDAVSHWINGQTIPKLRNLLAISEILGVSIEDLFQMEANRV